MVAVITGCYTAKDFEKLKSFLKEALPKKYIDSLLLLKKISIENTFGIFKGYILLALMAFGELLALFLILGFKNAFKKALIVAIVDLLPVFGVGTVLLPWAGISALSGNYSLCIKLVVIYLVVILARNMLEPKIVGNQINIHPVITLASIFVGLKLFGVAGLIVFPLSVTVLLHFLKEKYKQKYGSKSNVSA